MNQQVYLCGIGGIGMANVAILLKEAGYAVSGSDSAIYEPAASLLRAAQLNVRTPYAAENVPRDGTPILIGNALSRGHVEVEAALDAGLNLYSFPEFLGRFILPGRHPMVVAGTHGKSTTTACLAHLLTVAGIDPGFLMGAVPQDFPAGAHVGSGLPFVLEGDEYDCAFFDKRSKFLHYFPRTLVLGTVEYDHVDIFDSLDDMLASYRRLLNILPRNGSLVFAADSPLTQELAATAHGRRMAVGIEENADWQLLKSTSTLRFSGPDRHPYECAFRPIGFHNRLNAVMAFAAAMAYQDDPEIFLKGLESFHGIRRRLELLLKTEALVVYDDFAHHPTAIAASLAAVRERYPDARIIAAFEPRSNTMVRNVFQRDLPAAFSTANDVVIGTIHRQDRIDPANRLDVECLARDLRQRGIPCTPLGNEAIPGFVSSLLDNEPTVVIFMSNGSFDGVQREFVSRVHHGAPTT